MTTYNLVVLLLEKNHNIDYFIQYRLDSNASQKGIIGTLKTKWI